MLNWDDKTPTTWSLFSQETWFSFFSWCDKGSKEEAKHTNILKPLPAANFVIILTIKASHIVQSRVTVERNYQKLWIKEGWKTRTNQHNGLLIQHFRFIVIVKEIDSFIPHLNYLFSLVTEGLLLEGTCPPRIKDYIFFQLWNCM